MTPEEKRRILQERRAAKMANGSSRLNAILSLGGSVKAEAGSESGAGADPDATAGADGASNGTASTATSSATAANSATTATTATNNASTIPSASTTPSASTATNTYTEIKSSAKTSSSAVSGTSTGTARTAFHPNDDPDTSDIEQLLSQRASSAEPMDDLFSMLQNPQSLEDPFSAMMMNMMKQQQTAEGDTANLEDAKYEGDLLKYNIYQQKRLKMQFLVVRYLSIVANFWYHFSRFDTFRLSSTSMTRKFLTVPNQFFLIFMSIEFVILSSYYLITSKRRASENVGNDNLLIQGLAMALNFIPAVQKYQPIVGQLVKYWELMSMMVGDFALLVVLFGVSSRSI